MSDIAVVGSINADLRVEVERHPTPGETLMGTGGHLSPGGKGANQAVAAALLGADVQFIGAVGNDHYAPAAMSQLETSGVDLQHVASVDDATGIAIITVSADGENTIVVVPGANAHVNAEFVEKRAEVIHNAKIVLLQGEIPADGFAAAVENALKAKSRVVVNLAPVVPVDHELLRHADPIMANEHEANLILEMLGNKTRSEDPKVLAKALLDEGFKSVVLTLGAKGALVADAQGMSEIPAVKVSAKDTTGAGDAFAGAFVARIAQGDSLREAAQFAGRVGAFAVQSYGAQDSYPTLQDVLPE